jgi:t-SNARE complex subunit (syntaxin)
VKEEGRRKERQVEQGGDTYEKRHRTSGSERECEQVKNVCYVIVIVIVIVIVVMPLPSP